MYEYQDKCIALRCIHNLLPESPVEAVAVEWSTDYALLGDGEPELVSVKHRGPGQGDWTFGKLKDENVFRDLHAVWKAMGEAGDFVFESNAGYAREPALRVSRLTGFMRDIAGYADGDGASRVLEMAELRDIVAEESARASPSGAPASPAGSAPGYGGPGSVVEALPLAAAVLDTRHCLPASGWTSSG
jgi:hypothetical protein